MFWRKTQRESRLEILERSHLLVKPLSSIGVERICPTQSCTQVLHVQFAKPFNREIQTRIAIVEPLANAETFWKIRSSKFRSAVFTQQSHVIVPVIRAAFSFTMSRGRSPRSRQIHQAVPMDAVHDGQKQLRSALHAEELHLFSAE